LPWFVSVALLGWGCQSSDDQQGDMAKNPWSVSDGMLRAPDGRATLLRGVNIASAHKQAPYFGFHQARDFRRVHDEWGMNAVRLLMTWAAIEPERDAYDEQYLDALEERLAWAEAANLWVVLDMHQDVYGEGFGGDGAPRWTCDGSFYDAFESTEPWFSNYLNENVVACFDAFWKDQELQERYFAAWRKVAERFGNHPRVVGFDPMNEPFWGSTEVTEFESTILQEFYERAVAEIRRAAPHWVAFIEPCASRNLGVATQLTKFSFDNVVYAPHSYDLGAEAGNGFDPMHRETLLDNIQLLKQEADALGAALWIGEYGGDAAHPSIQEYMDAEYDGFAQTLAGSMYWAYDRDDGYGLLDAQGNEKSELLDVLVRPYPEFVNGDPISVSYDAASSVFDFAYRAGADVSLPSVISVPARAFPDGYEVDCATCAVTSEENRIQLQAHSDAGEIKVQIRPKP
jgi:endoglycosylceramidase